jgi:hypothetical protein
LGKLQRPKDINLRVVKKKLNSCIMELSNWMGSAWVKEGAVMLLGPTIPVWGSVKKIKKTLDTCTVFSCLTTN